MASDRVRVSLLDVGAREYGDAVLLQFGDTSVMIDGAHVGDDKGDATHPGIPAQLGRLLDQPGPPYKVDLLIVSHTHQDHVGCLPDLVHKDLLRCRWALMSHPGAAFGRAVGEPSPIDAMDNDKVRAVLAGLREEAPHPATTDLELLEMLDAAKSLEERYIKMLSELEAAGSQVVVPANPTGTEVSALLTEFDHLGLSILGPTPALLAATAEGIRGAMDSMFDAVVDLVDVDADASETDLFRRLLGPTFDGLDARDRPGNLVNLQSYTTTFEFSGVKLLLAGDMQFSDPQSGNDDIDDAVGELRAKVAANAPYSFVKLSHHGSGNGFDAQILEEMGTTKLYGISAGAHSSHHPDPEVLQLLESHKRKLSWVRSDRNGLTTVTFNKGRSRIRTSQGKKNDPQPNEVDAGTTPEASEVIAEPTVSQPLITAAGQVEVTTRIPNTPTTVRVTIEVDPEKVTARADPIRPLSSVGDFKLGSGRELPKLVFATNSEALAGNVGELEAAAAVEAIRSSGQTLVEMPPPNHDPTDALAAMRSALKDNPEATGVVLVGGYNVVPSTRMDCIPAEIRSKLGVTGDPDDFIVWSDDAFGDADNDQFPELPVSRIPDGRDGGLLRTAISVTPSQPTRVRSGIRNVHRPFAGDIYSTLSGDREFLVSEPYVFEAGSSAGVDGGLVYFMLHGDWNDSSRFWGEDTGGVEAVNVGNVPSDMGGATVFGGCCWGALTVDTPASKVVLGRPFGQKSPNASIALSVLRRGALAYVGCTGAHYSPVDAPYEYFGGPMHRSFWKGIGEGMGPAQALFDAKAEYAAKMPHGMNRPLEVAIEYKTLRQFSCLGLGW